jgi:uncharacterized membrane protein YbhN (UPF0104 family)
MANTAVAPVPAPAATPPPSPGFTVRLLLPTLATTAVVVGVWWLAKSAGPSWAAVRVSLRQVSLLDLGGLTLVWAAGLWCHSWVLTAAMPGLSRRRALLLNVSGSAVSDLIPFGAAAGAGVNLAMMRSWKFSLTACASFAVVHNVWNVLAKLALPTAILALVLANGTVRSPGLTIVVELALATGAVLGLTSVAVIANARIATGLGRTLDRLIGQVRRLIGSTRTTQLGQTLPAIRSQTAGIIRRGWLPMTAGMVSYLAMQAVLWALCLNAVGTVPTPTIMLAGFAVERVLSMLPFTPGGAGLAEAGSIAVLVSLGGDPVTTAAGVLLYRGFAFLLEIPVGGVGLLAWLGLRRWSRRMTPIVTPIGTP